MAVFNMFKLSILLSLLSNSNRGFWSDSGKKTSVGIQPPPTCSRIECPSYDAISVGNGYEIRHYNSSLWMRTPPIEDISFVEATRNGFLMLFDYIRGGNDYKQKIEMTAPVITEVSPGDGPFCASLFGVAFYVPKENQANPPPAEGLRAQKWKPVYAAVRQFSGFVADSDVGVEAAALQASIDGTIWADAIEKTHTSHSVAVYLVAQYNSPFESENRVNEIWKMFYMEDDSMREA